MAEWHTRSKRSPTGHILHRNRKKKSRDRGLRFLEPTVDKHAAKQVIARGGRPKMKLLSENKVSLANPKTRKVTIGTITSVKENRANPHFVRRNILTKGALIETDQGLARVTSRPGQDGVITAVLEQPTKTQTRSQ